MRSRSQAKELKEHFTEAGAMPFSGKVSREGFEIAILNGLVDPDLLRLVDTASEEYAEQRLCYTAERPASATSLYALRYSEVIAEVKSRHTVGECARDHWQRAQNAVVNA